MECLADRGLKSLPHSTRPREKLLERGPAALSDAELLALLLRTGVSGKHVLQLAQEVLDRSGGLAGLLNAGPKALLAIKGLGPAKRAEVAAVMELARRALTQELRETTTLDSPQAVRELLQMQIGGLPHEVFTVLYLNNQHQLLALEELFRGTLSQTSVYPREVVLRALHHQAAAVVLAHNHPSGAATPSSADEMVTRTLRSALGLIDVRVLDHFIVTRHQVTSMAELGLL